MKKYILNIIWILTILFSITLISNSCRVGGVSVGKVWDKQKNECTGWGFGCGDWGHDDPPPSIDSVVTSNPHT